MTQDAKALAPCPFCHSGEVSQDAWSVKCLECGVEMPGEVDRARTAWNRRALRGAEATEGAPVGWAYQDARWTDEGRWHLCATEPRATENRTIKRVFLEAALRSAEPENPVALGYTNWRGEFAVRSIIPLSVWFGSTEWLPLEALDARPAPQGERP